MPPDTPSPISPAALTLLVRQTDPEALLVSPRTLRRAAKRSAPARDYRPGPACLVPREALSDTLLPDGISLDSLPATVLLVPMPALSLLHREGPHKALTHLWRGLFHGAVLRALARLADKGALPADLLKARLQALGDDVVTEARDVLTQDHRLPDDDDLALYTAFAATFLELQAFEAERLPYMFPACCPQHTATVLALDLDAEQLLQASHPAGAEQSHPAPAPPPPSSANDSPLSADEAGPLQRQATYAASIGNNVRAALLYQRASLTAPEKQQGRLRSRARQHLSALVERLQKAFRLTDAEAAQWLACLAGLLPAAALGYWNRESKLLYDIQRACHDLEREIYAIDFVEWTVSLFQRPIQRELPDVGLVLACKYVRHAHALLPATRLDDNLRGILLTLLREAEQRLSLRLRETLRPKINAALDDAGLVPQGPAEQLARDQLIEELLDNTEEHGYLNLGDLRDAIARNRLNLPDLAPSDLLWGDPLLRANTTLAHRLDGIYRKGEAYLRLMQVFSSLFFGTATGRNLSVYLLLPVLAGVCSVVFIDAMIGEVAHLPEMVQRFFESDPPPAKKAEFKLNLFDVSTTTGTAAFLGTLFAASLFYLLLIHAPSFRSLVWHGMVWLWRGVRGALWDVPEFLLRLPLVRAILDSHAVLALWHHVLLPLLLTVPVTLLLWLAGAGGLWAWGVNGAWFLFVQFAANTQMGRRWQEAVLDWLWQTWLHLRDDFLVGIWLAIVQFFRWAVERITAALYTVDEWLRFRKGEGRLAFVTKGVLGLFWFAITYVFRFLLLLFVEPQVNPIKHFPVVTVGHKLSLLLVPFVAALPGMNHGWALLILGLIPGIYGFIAWELKENWRLYTANQSDHLEGEIIGSHGEWMVNYLRPGFHSGTLPYLFSRLRRTTGASYRRAEDALHHAEDEIRRFVHRAFLVPLHRSLAWDGQQAVEVGTIRLAVRSIRVELLSPCLGSAAWVEFALQGTELAAGVREPGWMANVRGVARDALEAMLVGLYMRAGVNWLRWPTAHDLGPRPVPWTLWADWWECDRANHPRPVLLPDLPLLPVSRS